ncbi:MAG: hypothetical protein ABIK15_04010 [Pseudomonadota bacterium]
MAILGKKADNSNNNVIIIHIITINGNQRVSDFLTGCKREKTGTLFFPGGIPQGLRCKETGFQKNGTAMNNIVSAERYRKSWKTKDLSSFPRKGKKGVCVWKLSKG